MALSSTTDAASRAASLTPPASNSSLSALQLRAGLNILPQELRDEIFQLTFTYNDEGRDISMRWEVVPGRDNLKLKTVWQPPTQLHVNHQTRQDFAQKYYGSTTPWFVDSPIHLHHAHSWWCAQSELARNILEEVVYDEEKEGDAALCEGFSDTAFMICEGSRPRDKLPPKSQHYLHRGGYIIFTMKTRPVPVNIVRGYQSVARREPGRDMAVLLRAEEHKAHKSRMWLREFMAQ